MKLTRLSSLVLFGALVAPAMAYTAVVDGSAPVDEPKPIDDDKAKALKVGGVVPERLVLKDFEGNSTSFKDLRGKTVIVHFWSYRCPAERHANPIFKKMEDRFASSKDIVMIGIVSNQNELGPTPAADADYSKHYKELRDKSKDVGYKHTILADHGNKVSDLFGARSTPHCYVIDKKGVIQYSGALDDDPRGQKGDDATNYVVEVTKAVVDGKPTPYKNTKPYG
jgi:thiol-disulfide isomerase/thioredoxin